ncbi:anti-sigma factor [Flagellimonas sp. HMM57]|uniref:anti-sigma factor n=1 Tax=unclassified Flagellimonas TaxID=2644544 RepID=UPI0013D87A1A|nr:MULTISPECIES: anti-sigma factor [unclassified Flagellimonas]UII76551.1 anti-sigma factor [Flagellimonas sp. HMM57]
MMEKDKILEEGLLEQYLTGELSKEDTLLVENILKKDSELKQHFLQMQDDLEKMGFENAVTPPFQVKHALQKQLEDPIAKKTNWMPFIAAASLALVFMLSAIWLYTKWQNAEENLESLQITTADLQNRLDNLEQNYLLTSNRLETINNPNVIPLVLYGNNIAPNSKAVAYVNHKSKLVMINPQGLPKLPADKTYQMWSDVDGEMINMGLVPTDKELVTLKYIDSAESLNITIEPAGGNDHPTVEQLVSNVLL